MQEQTGEKRSWRGRGVEDQQSGISPRDYECPATRPTTTQQDFQSNDGE